MATTNLVPPIGAKGTYTLSGPYVSAIATNVVYTCISIRRLSDLVADGVDPKAKYYDAYSIDTSKYKEDLSGDVCIVGLQPSGSGTVVYVPSTYIASYPSGSGVPYVAMVMGVSLGALPSSTDLDVLKTKLSNVVTETIGVTAEVKVMVTSSETIITDDTHARLVAARKEKISTADTDYTKLVALTEKYSALLAAHTALEEYVLAHQ